MVQFFSATRVAGAEPRSSSLMMQSLISTSVSLEPRRFRKSSLPPSIRTDCLPLS